MERYQAGMVLLEVGSRVGYLSSRQGRRRSQAQPGEPWEGLERALERVEKRMVPLDVLMHIATAEALLAGMTSHHAFYEEAVKRYLTVMEKHLGANEEKRHATNTRTDPGVSAAVRGLCIGMRFPRPEHLTDLIHTSVECGRMTHTCPTGFLGCFCVALFASYATQGTPVSQWGRCMLGVLPQAEQYCRETSAAFTDYSENWFYFETKWQLYLQHREIDREGRDDPFFPENYNCGGNKVHRRWCMASPGKRKGVELPMMVYEALLVAGGDWTRLCLWGWGHGGDSEGAGCILGCLYGLLYGSVGVPSAFLLNLGLKDLMEKLGEALYSAANGDRPKPGDDAAGSDDVCRCSGNHPKSPKSPGRFPAELWQAVKRLSCKRTNDEINALLNYTALLAGGVAGWQDSGGAGREVGKERGRGKGRGKGAGRPSQPHPSRFQLLRSRFTKLGLSDSLHRPRPPPRERPISRRLALPRGEGSRNDVSESSRSRPPPAEERHPKSLGVPLLTCTRIRTRSESPSQSPETRGPESSPETTGPESSPETTGPELGPETTGPESSPETTGPESSPKTTGPESSPETTGPESSPETIEPESSPETTGPESSPETTGPESSPKTTGPESSPETTGPESSPETIEPESSPETTGPESSPETIEPESSPETTGPESSPETTGPESSPETTGPESSPEIGTEFAPEIVGAESIPQTIGPESLSEWTEPDSSSEMIGPGSLSKWTVSSPETTGLESPPERKAQHRPAYPPHSPKPLPWKYRTHCYPEDLCTPPPPKILLSVGMRGGRLVKIS